MGKVKRPGFCIIEAIALSLVFFSGCSKEKPATLPDVTTTPVTGVLYTTALSGGTITYGGGAAILAAGVCWGVASDPTTGSLKTADGTGEGSFISSITGLTAGTLYYVRAYATNSVGTVYGNEYSFTTHVTGINFNSSLVYGNLTDISGKTYKTIQIGSQVWMAENLKTTQYYDGTPIPLVTDNATWQNLLTPAYCWFDNNQDFYENIYGAYYNWFAVASGKLCPIGWHVPSDTEWQHLVDFLGGNNTAGSKIKETGTNNWVTANSDALNSSGFTGLPGGLRGSLDGLFSGQGTFGGWWSSTEIDPSPLSAAWCRWIHADTAVIAHSQVFKIDGFNVRCLEDQD